MPSQFPSRSCSPPLWPTPPIFIVLSHTVYSMGYPLGQLVSAILILSSPSFLCLPSPSLAGQYEKLKCPWLCTATAQQQLKHPCVINIGFLPKAKYSTILDTITKKTNSVPSETRTVCWLLIYYLPPSPLSPGGVAPARSCSSCFHLLSCVVPLSFLISHI